MEQGQLLAANQQEELIYVGVGADICSGLFRSFQNQYFLPDAFSSTIESSGVSTPVVSVEALLFSESHCPLIKDTIVTFKCLIPLYLERKKEKALKVQISVIDTFNF